MRLPSRPFRLFPGASFLRAVLSLAVSCFAVGGAAVLGSAVLGGCVHEIPSDGSGETPPLDGDGLEGDGTDISISIKLSDLVAPGLSTRSEESDDHLHGSYEISSLALALFKFDEEHEEDSRIVAYRIFIDPEASGHFGRYFYSNVIGANALDEVPISDAGGRYALGEDDSTPEDSPYGFNGFVKGEGGINEEVRMSFLFDNPLHGSVEKLRAGRYYLVALANFNESPSPAYDHTVGFWIKENVSYWQRHQDDPGFDGIVYHPCLDAGAHEGLFGGSRMLVHARVLLMDVDPNGIGWVNPPEPTTGQRLSDPNDTIVSPSYIHNPNTKLISSCVDEVNLQYGPNDLDLDLRRVASRATFRISNQGTAPIRIEEFALSDNFGSAATYLFPSEEHFYGTIENSRTWHGAPKVTSSRALVPFDQSTVYAPGAVETFFDAILAPVVDDTYPLSYELEVAVVDEDPILVDSYSVARTHTPYADILSELGSADWAVGDSRLFLIRSQQDKAAQSGNKRVFIKANGTSIPKGDPGGIASAADDAARVEGLLNSSNPDLSHLWELVKVDNVSVRIKSVANGHYLEVRGTSSNGDALLYTTDPAYASVFEITRYTNNGGHVEAVAFTTEYNGTAIYLNMLSSGNRTLEWVSLSRWNDLGSHFFLHPTTIETTVLGEIRKRIEVPVMAFDRNVGKPEPLHELRHNDHLNVSITVNYNHETKDFSFELREGQKKNNTVEFN